MTEELETIHLVRNGGKNGEPASVWCGRFIGPSIGATLSHLDRRTHTRFLAVHADNLSQGPTCGACRRIVGMLKTAGMVNEADKRQRYRQRKK